MTDLTQQDEAVVTNKYNSRKFIVAIILLVAAVVAVVFKVANVDDFIRYSVMIYAIYSGVNVADKWVDKKT